MKISEWLKDHTDSHGIFIADKIAASFKRETGHDACWPVYEPARIRRDVEARGLGGHVNDDLTAGAYGWEIARWCAHKFANFSSSKSGRGFEWRDCIEALERAGQ